MTARGLGSYLDPARCRVDVGGAAFVPTSVLAPNLPAQERA
jgi:hypothetical protein